MSPSPPSSASPSNIEFDWDAAERELGTSSTPSRPLLLNPSASSTSVSSSKRPMRHSPSPSTDSVLAFLRSLMKDPPARQTPRRVLSPGNSTVTSSNTSSALETVDLSHRKISSIDPQVIALLSQGNVERLALGYNHLTSLPLEFSNLGSTLRYLNVRVNNISIFPQVLCELRSLEILDISKNRIRTLPRDPGHLVHLKVFSISKNHIKHLPQWIAKMSHLRVLKTEGNDIEWPPPDISTQPTFASDVSKTEEVEGTQRWLATLQRWIHDHSGDHGSSYRQMTNLDSDSMSHRQPLVSENDMSSDDDRQTTESTPRTTTLNYPRSRQGELSSTKVRRPTPPLTSGSKITSTPQGRSGLSASNTFTSPALDPNSTRAHSRNASHTITPRGRPELVHKKSLPDLRQTHEQILQERMSPPDTATMLSPISSSPGTPRRQFPDLNSIASTYSSTPSNNATPRNPTNLSQTQSARAAVPILAPPIPLHRSQSDRPIPTPLATSKPQESKSYRAGSDVSVAQRNQTLSPSFLNSDAPPLRTDSGGAGSSNPAEQRVFGPLDRNSGEYFRRLSILPPLTMSKTFSSDLLRSVDAVRGVLFSLSQIYSALHQFILFATHDALPGALSKVLSSADTSMKRFIDILDRFDSATRRNAPSDMSLVREVFERCRDNVGVFSKVVNILAIQLKLLINSADIRYTRTLILMLYGSMGELARSWEIVTSLSSSDGKSGLDVLAHYIFSSPSNNSSSNTSAASSAKPNSPGANSEPVNVPQPRPPNPASAHNADRSRARRHAGSFSVEDVQLGANMPPASLPSVEEDMPPVPPLGTAVLSSSLSTSSSTSPISYVERDGRTYSPPPSLSGSGRAGSRKPSKGTLPPPAGISTGTQRAISPDGSPSSPNTALYTDIYSQWIDSPTQSAADGQFESSPPLVSLASTPSINHNINGPILEQKVVNGSTSSTGHTSETESTPAFSPVQTLSSPVIQSREPNKSLGSAITIPATTTTSVPTSAPAPPPQQSRLAAARSAAAREVDEKFLDMADATTNIALTVYSMLSEELSGWNQISEGSPGTAQGNEKDPRITELIELCDNGDEIARKLRQTLSQLSGSIRNGSGPADDYDEFEAGANSRWARISHGLALGETARVWDETNMFAYTVTQIASLARDVSTMRAFPKTVREGLGQLAKTTKELATLLQVSSFADARR